MKIVRLLIGSDCPPKRKGFSARAFMAGYDGSFPGIVALMPKRKVNFMTGYDGSFPPWERA
jgi:hypothetical protein